MVLEDPGYCLCMFRAFSRDSSEVHDLNAVVLLKVLERLFEIGCNI